MTQNERYLTLIIRSEEELFEAFAKVEVLMFFDERALNISLLIFFESLKLSLLMFLASASRRTSKLKELQKALPQHSGSLIYQDALLDESSLLALF